MPSTQWPVWNVDCSRSTVHDLQEDRFAKKFRKSRFLGEKSVRSDLWHSSKSTKRSYRRDDRLKLLKFKIRPVSFMAFLLLVFREDYREDCHQDSRSTFMIEQAKWRYPKSGAKNNFLMVMHCE